ncbi:MAG: MmgE/PrpD family protein, partial [Chloroflexota bacterium]
PVVRKVKEIILDSLGCQLGGAQLENGRMIIEYVRNLGDRSESSVVGSSFMRSVADAVLANATLAHADELDESFQTADGTHVGHIAAIVVPVSLAMAEKEKLSGRQVIQTVVLGYELSAMMARALGPISVSRRRLWGTYISGAFGAAAAAGNMLGLEVPQLRVALGLAAGQIHPFHTFFGEKEHMLKSLQIGTTTRSGVTAAYLAKLGYGGPESIMDGPNGIFSILTGGTNSQSPLIGAGSQFELLYTCFKKYAAGHPIHSPVEGLLRIMAREALSAADIEKLQVKIPTHALSVVGDSPTPSLNLPYNLAVAAFDRRVGWEQHTAERQADPQVRALQARIEIIPSAELDELEKQESTHPAVVELTTRTGQRFSERVLHPPGDPRNPMSQAELVEKFYHLATKTIAHAQAKELIERIQVLEEIQDVTELTKLLRIPA